MCLFVFLYMCYGTVEQINMGKNNQKNKTFDSSESSEETKEDKENETPNVKHTRYKPTTKNSKAHFMRPTLAQYLLAKLSDV